MPSQQVQSLVSPVSSEAQKRGTSSTVVLGPSTVTFDKHLGKGKDLTCARVEELGVSRE